MQKVTKGVMKKKFATLVLSMLKIGCIGFGGGSALIPVLQKEAVQDKGLITEDELDSDIVAASITPGALPVEIAAGIGKTDNADVLCIRRNYRLYHCDIGTIYTDNLKEGEEQSGWNDSGGDSDPSGMDV